MESDRQVAGSKSHPSGDSMTDASSLIFPDLGESCKALEKSLDELENIVKLFKSDMSKPLPFNISDYNFPSSLINGSPEK